MVTKCLRKTASGQRGIILADSFREVCFQPFGPVAFGPVAKQKYMVEDIAHLMPLRKRKEDARPTLRVCPQNLTSSTRPPPLKVQPPPNRKHR